MNLNSIRRAALGLIVLAAATIAGVGSPVARADGTAPSITVTPFGFGEVLVQGANWAPGKEVLYYWANEQGLLDYPYPPTTTTTIAYDFCSRLGQCFSDPGGTFRASVVVSDFACDQVDSFWAEGQVATDPASWTTVSTTAYVPCQY